MVDDDGTSGPQRPADWIAAVGHIWPWNALLRKPVACPRFCPAPSLAHLHMAGMWVFDPRGLISSIFRGWIYCTLLPRT